MSFLQNLSTPKPLNLVIPGPHLYFHIKTVQGGLGFLSYNVPGILESRHL